MPVAAKIKMTRREKDCPAIGELARQMPDLADRIRCSRSPRELVRLCARDAELAAQLAHDRPLLNLAICGESQLDELAAQLDAERRILIKADAERVTAYEAAPAWPHRMDWSACFP